MGWTHNRPTPKSIPILPQALQPMIVEAPVDRAMGRHA